MSVSSRPTPLIFFAWLCTATIFVSAALLFIVQPMFARMVLPLLGGSPAVWNTAMVFFQAMLLAGYAYAHASTAWLGARRQARWHLLVVLLPLAVLPLAVPAGWHPPVDGHPGPWLLALMTVAIGLPFFVLSATAPLIQKWFAGTNHPRAADPYFLYAASNGGSLLALLGYPLWVEPGLSLSQQSRWWSAGYLGLAGLLGLVVLLLWRQRPAAVAMSGPADSAPGPTGGTRLRWVALSFVPSSLLLGVTTYLCSDIAVVPLLWVVPLALYLLTFVLAFARRAWLPQSGLARALPMLLVPVAMLLAVQAAQPAGLLAGFHLAAFFVATLLCHLRLAEARPAASRLTEFYLWLAVGGVLGGVFNALVAPLLFNSILEYPLMLVIACVAALPAAADRSRRARWGDWIWPAGLAVLAAVLLPGIRWAGLETYPATAGVVFGVLALGCYIMSRRRLRLALGVAVLLLAGGGLRHQPGQLLEIERSFFGVHRVTVDESGRFHDLLHGRTLHGRQNRDSAMRREPLTYYHRSGPIGQVMAQRAADPRQKIAAVGLGAGSMAAYAQPGQEWTFYEIDPVVQGFAADPRYFTFLEDSQGLVKVVLGDARRSLAEELDGEFDLVVLDAYSSDAIPVHLVTREALALYLRVLAPDGLLAFHISNLHLDLEPVFANLAADAGLVSLVRDDTMVPDALAAEGKSPSVWLVMARRPEDLRPLTEDPRWQRPRSDAGQRVWTDDYSSILSVFRWR